MKLLNPSFSVSSETQRPEKIRPCLFFLFSSCWKQSIHSKIARFLCLGLLICIGVNLRDVYAQKTTPDLVEMTTPRLMGMGHAGRGSAQSNHALIANPAGLSNGSFYSIETAYFRSTGELNTLNLNIVDSQRRYTKDRFSLGLAYNHVLQGSNVIAYEGRLGFALPLLLNQGFTLLTGGAAKYQSNDLIQKDGFNLDWGILMVMEGLQLGLVGENLLDEDGGRRFGGGLSLLQRIFTLGVDYMYTPETENQTVYGGLEILLGAQWIIRGGYETQIDSSLFNWVSGGIGLNGLAGQGGSPSLSSLNLAYRRNLETEEFIFGLNWGLLLK